MKGRYTGKLRLRQHDECSGHCCKAFTLEEPVALTARLDTYLARGPSDRMFDEASKLREMLIYIGPGTEHPELRAADGSATGPKKDHDHYYTCKHFDGDRCTNYASRPRMCADYPYDKQCSYVDCTAKPSGPSCATIIDYDGRWTGTRESLNDLVNQLKTHNT